MKLASSLMTVGVAAFSTAIVDGQLTERVNVSSAGVQGNFNCSAAQFSASVSADGRYVTFYGSATNLVVGDTNGREDVFVRDRQTGQTTRVSVDSAGVQGDGNSYSPTLSADGRWV